jgi:hypothetical protein
MVFATQSMWQRIAAKAYALYEERGRREGYALQDWFDALNREIYEPIRNTVIRSAGG